MKRHWTISWKIKQRCMYLHNNSHSNKVKWIEFIVLNFWPISSFHKYSRTNYLPSLKEREENELCQKTEPRAVTQTQWWATFDSLNWTTLKVMPSPATELEPASCCDLWLYISYADWEEQKQCSTRFCSKSRISGKLSTNYKQVLQLG